LKKQACPERSRMEPISRAVPGNPKFEYRNPKQFESAILKKQSQFVMAQIIVSAYDTDSYSNIPPCGAR
jgi:hypothetical protein